jgi:hypothetical protein
MAMTHEQIDEQMVDFLYGELPADARAAFEAHVAGCDRCRREVESFGQVRAVARTVLDESPPARVHDAILRAAREAAAAAPAKEALKEPKKEAKKAEPARASLWDWVRGKWAFPTLATVGALAVFILGSRLFLNPNTVHQLGRPAPMSEPGASTPVLERPMESTGAPRMVEKLAPAAPATTPAPAEGAPRDEVPAHTAHVRRRLAAEAKTAANDGARPARAAKRSINDDALSGFFGSGAGAREKSAKRDDRLEGLGDPARDKAAPTGGAGYAEPPAPVAEKPQSDIRPASRALAKKKAVSAVEDMEEDRVQAKEEAAPATSLRGTGQVYAQPPPPAAAPAPAAASRPRSRAEEAESDSVVEEQAARETLVQRADRLFTQGRWAEAAVAYRDLLRQQPNSPDAERWRRRLAAARAAVATGRPPSR